jgi:uncharacterized membrane protein
VLEVKVPELTDRGSAEELLHALLHHGYVIGAYFFSFAMLGLFWVWHHRLAEQVREIDLPLLVCALSFLALVCFFPFASALLGRYTSNLAALLVYVPVIGLILLLQTLFFWLAMRRGLVVENFPPAKAHKTHQHNLMGMAIFCFACTPTLMRLNVFAPVIGIALVEERGGFEPPRRYRPPDFESGTFNHSATSPNLVRAEPSIIARLFEPQPRSVSTSPG